MQQQPAPFLGSASGLTRQRLRSPRLQRQSRDVYVFGDRAATPELAVEAALLALPDAVISHATAAWWLGLPGRRGPLVHLTRAPVAGVSVRPGVVTHRTSLRASEVVLRRGVRVTSPVRTWLDLAALLPPVPLIELGDAVARAAGVDAMRLALLEARGRRGVARARAALPLVDPGADSPAETRCRLLLHEAGFTALQHGVVVRDRFGGWLSAPDLADPQARVAVQYDGLHHLVGDPRQRRRDIDRDELTRAAGWEVVVLVADDLRHPLVAAMKVRAAYARAAARRA